MRLRRCLASLLVGLALLGPTLAAKAAPAMWRLESGESVVHFLGTIHLLKKDTPWFTPEMKALVERADTLTLEILIDEVNPMEAQQAMAELGFYPPGETLSDHLPETLRTRIMAEAQKAGLPTQAVERMKPWLVGVTLTSQLAAQAGYLSEYGVESTLLEVARASDTRLRQLETMQQQLQIFASLSEDAQVAWLRDGLDEFADLENYVEGLKTAWVDGDVDRVAAMLTEGMEASPQLADRLLYARNRDWVAAVESLLGESGRHLVAVGAGHLVGESSLIDLLRERGHEVERVKAVE